MKQRCNGYSNSRPGDIYHPDFEQGHSTHFDITVRNSFQPSLVVRASNQSGLAAKAGEEAEDDLHQASVTAAGGIFHPIVVETFGLWSSHSLDVSKSITQRPALHNHRTVSQAISYLHQQLSIKVCRYNSKMVLERLALDSSDDIFGSL